MAWGLGQSRHFIAYLHRRELKGLAVWFWPWMCPREPYSYAQRHSSDGRASIKAGEITVRCKQDSDQLLSKNIVWGMNKDGIPPYLLIVPVPDLWNAPVTK